MSNTITAYFKGRIGVAESVYQNDYGIVMVFDSIELPAHFDCYFTVTGSNTAIPGVGADNRVAIPNTVLAKSGKVEIHIPLHTGDNDSEVEYVVYFKVIGRARPEDDGTPAQMTAVEKALALLSQPITNIEEIVNEALSFTGDTFDEMKAALDADIADLESDFAILQAGFDTAVGAVTTDSEVTNIRVGADETTYTTAGTAVRTQISNIKSENDLLSQGIYDILADFPFSQGVYTNSGTDSRASGIKCNTLIHPTKTIRVKVTITSGYRLLARRFGSADISQGALSTQEFNTNTFYDLSPDYYYGFIIQKTDDSNIYVNERSKARVLSYRTISSVPSIIKVPDIFMSSTDHLKSLLKDIDNRIVIMPKGEFTMDGGQIAINNCENFKIIGNGCVISNINSFVANSSNDFIVDGLTIKNATNSGIELITCNRFRICNCSVDTAEQGIRTITNCADFSIDNCYVANTEKDGILIYQTASNFSIDSNKVSNAGAIGIEVEGRDGDGESVTKLVINDFVISNNITSGCDDWGYLVIAGNDFTFHGNVGIGNVGAGLFIGCEEASISNNILEGSQKGFEVSHQYFPPSSWITKNINVIGNCIKSTISRIYDGVFSIMNGEDITVLGNNILVEEPAEDYIDTLKALRIGSVKSSLFTGNTIDGDGIAVGIAIERGYDYTTEQLISDASKEIIVSNNNIKNATKPVKIGQFGSDTSNMSGFVKVDVTNNYDGANFATAIETTGITYSEVLRDVINGNVVEREILTL